MMRKLIQRWVKRTRQPREDRDSRTIGESRSAELKSLKLLIPLLLVLMALCLILFKVERQNSQWTVEARDWTGFGQSYDEDALTVTEKGTETTGTSKKETTKTTTTTKRLQPAKTLWDWMGLLLAPATLAGLGFAFQASQEKAKRDKEAADKKRDADQQREQALQTYFDQLSELLVDKQLKKLLAAKPATALTAKPEPSTDAIDAEAALDVVKARTLALLRMFKDDITRKASVLSFLADADLISQLDLDLSGINLKGANLKKANFFAYNLRDANLSDANLSDANLCDANLDFANLIGACFIRAVFTGAELGDANLSDANLNLATLIGAYLGGATLIGAHLVGANLSDADLSDVNLSGAVLIGTNLSDANLSGANFSDATLTNANLSGADLSSAQFWSPELTGDELYQAKKAAVASIRAAKNWQSAHYASEMRELLVPPKTSKAAANNENPTH